MQKWILEGLMIGMATIVVGGGVSILFPDNAKATLVGSGLGAVVGSVILAKRHRQVLSQTELQLKAVQTEIAAYQFETHYSQINLNTLEAQLKSKEEKLKLKGLELSNQESAASNWRANIETLKDQLKSTQLELAEAQTEAFNAQSELSAFLEELEQKPNESKADLKILENQNSEATFIIDEPLNQDEEADGHSDKDVAIAWFANKKIIIESQHLPKAQDKIFNKHAVYLGEHLRDENGEPLLAPLLKQIRWAISQNRGVQFHFKKASQNQMRIITLFSRNLFDDTLLSSYRYNKNNDQKIIHAAIQDRADVRAFFDGMWFERFICYRACSVLDEKKTYSYLMNPIIKFENGDRFELDLFFVINGQPLLIECKTGGNFTSHIKRFDDHCKRLSLSPSNAYLVILDLKDTQSENLSQLWKFTVVNQDGLLDCLQKFSKDI